MSQSHILRHLAKMLKKNMANLQGDNTSTMKFDPLGFMDNSPNKIIYNCNDTYDTSAKVHRKLLDLHIEISQLIQDMGYKIIDNGSWSLTNFDLCVSSKFYTGDLLVCCSAYNGVFISTCFKNNADTYPVRFSLFIPEDRIEFLDKNYMKCIISLAGFCSL